MKINVAIIGYGMAGKSFHMEHLSLNNNYLVKMIMTNNLARQKEIKNDYPDVEIITNFDQALKDSEIDLIVIATANDVHYEYTKKALEACKHVVCEKPFVESFDKALKLFKIARENNVLLRVYHNRTYDGDLLTIKNLLKTQDFGRLLSFKARFNNYNPTVSTNWRYQDTLMNGIFYDLAPHLVYHVIELFGMPNALNARFSKELENAITDDHFEITLYYEHDFVCYLEASFLERMEKPRFEIKGVNKSYFKIGYDNPDNLTSKPESKYQNNNLISILVDQNLKSENIPLLLGMHYEFYNKVYVDILNQSIDNEEITRSLNTIKVMELAIKSNETKQIINH